MVPFISRKCQTHPKPRDNLTLNLCANRDVRFFLLSSCFQPSLSTTTGLSIAISSAEFPFKSPTTPLPPPTGANLQLHQDRSDTRRYNRKCRTCLRVIHRLAQPGQRDITEGVRAKKFANLFRRVGRGNQLLTSGSVDAVIARRNRGRTTDADVHFPGSGFANHAYDLAASSTANDGVVDQHDALAFDQSRAPD